MACALLSLDAIEPLLEDIGFKLSEALQLRDVCRQYLELWKSDDRYTGTTTSTHEPSADSAEWLAGVGRDHGESFVARLLTLSSRLGSRHGGLARDGWTELMVRLPQEVERGSKPHLSPKKLQALKTLANGHLEAMKRLHERVESVAAEALSSDWDQRLLESNFYPADDEHADDEGARRFDPRGWLWELLAVTEWRSFAESLHMELSDSEVEELISWGKAIPQNAFGKYLAASF